MSDATNPWRYPECELLRRDIVYFYELQSDYATIEPDIAWDLFELRYWECLATPEPSNEHFLERGCLAVIIAGALAHGGNVCQAFGATQIGDCRASVAAAHFSDAITERIRVIALRTLDLAVVDNRVRDYDLLARFPDAEWVHASTVRAYFRSRSETLRGGGSGGPDCGQE